MPRRHQLQPGEESPARPRALGLVLLLVCTSCVRALYSPFDAAGGSDRPGADSHDAQVRAERTQFADVKQGDGMPGALVLPEDCSEPTWPTPGKVIRPTPGTAIHAVLSGAAAGTTVLLADGTYQFAGGAPVQIKQPGLIVRGESGAPDKVVIQTNGQILGVYASDVVLANFSMTQGNSMYVGVAGRVTGVRVYRLALADLSGRYIAVGSDFAGGFPDDGTIACSSVTMGSAFRASLTNCYATAIGIIGGRGWRVRDNQIAGMWCLASGDNGAGIVLGAGARDTVIERNRIRDSHFGIRVGSGSVETPRTYPDLNQGCSYPPSSALETIGGVVRNNFVAAGDSNMLPAPDSAINVWNGCDTQVLHNTVFFATAPSSAAIEWRFSNTRITVENNLTSHGLRDREGAVATQAGNMAIAAMSWLVAPDSGDLHLTPAGTLPVGAGAKLSAGLCDNDIDRQPRKSPPTVGADEK